MNKKVPSYNYETVSEVLVDPSRIIPILWVAIAAVIACIFFSSKFLILVRTLLYIALGLLLLSQWFAHKGMVRQALLLFMIILTSLTCALIYGAAGIHDEAIILFPSLLMFGSMFGSRRQFLILFAFLALFLTTIVVVELHGWHTSVVQENNLESLLITLVILSASAFFVSVLTNDLRKALLELNTSKRTLQELNDQLEQRVALRTIELEKTQIELGNAEKLASLGAMVAGISHELNTPIGNTLLAASSLELLIDDVEQKTQLGTLKISSLKNFLETAMEISSLITRSSKRAADMISSFKQVAVDQTSEQRRWFDLRDVIEDNLLAIMPVYKSRQISIENTVPPGIQCGSYPGPLGQILTNIIQNSMLHAFADGATGTIHIFAEHHNEQVTLTVADNGVGMTPNVVAHVFDPFFTTRLGKGGSGLGMSISYRIATSVLGGTLTAKSGLGQGATFVLSFPKTAPFPI